MSDLDTYSFYCLYYGQHAEHYDIMIHNMFLILLQFGTNFLYTSHMKMWGESYKKKYKSNNEEQYTTHKSICVISMLTWNCENGNKGKKNE